MVEYTRWRFSDVMTYQPTVWDYYNAYQQQRAQQQAQARPSSGGVSLPPGLVSKGLDKILSQGGAQAAGDVGASSTPALTEASQAAWNAGAGEASQAAWNAGATGAADTAAVPGAAASSPFSLSGFGSAGNYSAPTLGAALAADVIANRRHGKRGAAQGATSGALIGSYFGGVPGAAIGAAIGGGVGYFGNFGDVDKWKTEQDRIAALQKAGVPAPNAIQLEKGRSKASMQNPYVAADFIGIAPSGQWTNNKFNMSRSEADLRPEDVLGYAAFGEKLGNDFYSAPEAVRKDIAAKALSSNAIKEHHGTIDINWGAELEKYAKEKLGKKK